MSMNSVLAFQNIFQFLVFISIEGLTMVLVVSTIRRHLSTKYRVRKVIITLIALYKKYETVILWYSNIVFKFTSWNGHEFSMLEWSNWLTRNCGLKVHDQCIVASNK
jgi:hypothetical protein